MVLVLSTVCLELGKEARPPGQGQCDVRFKQLDLDALGQKIQARLTVLAQSDARIPDPTIQSAFNWAKFNLADMRRIVTDAQIRDTMEGTVYPAPLASFPLLSGFGVGYPDSPGFLVRTAPLLPTG